MHRVYPPLNTMQVEALREFATMHGPAWKAELRDQWISARTTGLLHQLRNSHGPSWLTDFQLPKPQED